MPVPGHGLERVTGIEPVYSAWKAAALPLCYTREERQAARPFRPAPIVCATSAIAPLRKRGGGRKVARPDAWTPVPYIDCNAVRCVWTTGAIFPATAFSGAAVPFAA